MTTVWIIYVDTDKEVGDVDHLKVFAREELADAWLAEHDPEGKAFSYSVGSQLASPVLPRCSTRLKESMSNCGTVVASADALSKSRKLLCFYALDTCD